MRLWSIGGDAQRQTISLSNDMFFNESAFLLLNIDTPGVEFQKRNFEVVLRKVSETPEVEEYRIVTLNVAVEVDDPLSHPDVFEIIGERVVHIEKIDQLRWRLKN